MSDSQPLQVTFSVKALLFPLYILPRPLKILLARSVVWFWVYVLKIRVQETLNRIQRVFPEQGAKENKRLLKESFFNSMMTLIELSYFPFNAQKIYKYTHVKGAHNLKAAQRQQRPVFLLTGHMGNGEIILYRICAEGYKLKLIGKRVGSAFLDQALFQLREISGLRHIPPKKALKGLVRALKEKSTVVFVNDQFTHPPGGVQSTFLGLSTYTNAALARLTLKFDALVLPVNIYREPDTSTSVHFYKPLEFSDFVLDSSQPLEQRIQVLTQDFNTALEAMILERPGQWMWVHRRWKLKA